MITQFGRDGALFETAEYLFFPAAHVIRKTREYSLCRSGKGIGMAPDGLGSDDVYLIRQVDGLVHNAKKPFGRNLGKTDIYK